ncbi:unnamed protein product [Mytilus edulis]|uniref:Uncharacterized protein n=1 Tax=Mytilus edulis TaxID=6550 RepID=A0A8S3RDY6_MYTED|nr:unnamed protein product [Mytilus edulis]
MEVRTSDIEYVCQVLTDRYLVNRDGAYDFQHQAIMDSVLISYSKISSKAIIPLLHLDHMVDLVRPHNYIEQEDEVVIKISKPYYPEIIIQIISLIQSDYYPSRSSEIKLDWLIKSKFITENDIDLIYQLILCIYNEQGTLKHYRTNYINHFVPLYLLRNIGKFDDEMLTVNHTKYDNMLISVTIGDKNISISVDPSISLIHAFQSKYNDICKWLLKNADCTLLHFSYIFDNIMPYRYFECTKLLLENVNHNMINMTQLFLNTCFRCNNEEINEYVD